jgi:hypothetical protein
VGMSTSMKVTRFWHWWVKYCELLKILGICAGIHMNVKYCSDGTNHVVSIYHVADHKPFTQPSSFWSTAKAPLSSSCCKVLCPNIHFCTFRT